MAESDGVAPLPRERFEEAVLVVVGAVLRTDRRIDLVADDTLGEGPLRCEGADFRVDLILCAAECLRLMTTLPGGRARVARDFPAFAAACRMASVPDVNEPGAQALHRRAVGLPPKIGAGMHRGDGRSLIEVITRAVEEARRRGHDQSGQIDHAVAAVMVAEPTLSRAAARRLVETLGS